MADPHVKHPRFRARLPARGAALIVTLATLVLLTALVLVFFDLGRINRQISFTSASQYRAETMAHTGIDTMVGDLRNEIVAGSAQPAANLYLPLTNQNIVPAKADDQGFANLVAQSASGINLWPATSSYATPGPMRSAPTANSTKTPSRDGRYISVNRWNKAGLLGDPGPGATPAAPGPSPYTPPDWVVVTRQGAVDYAGSATPPTVTSFADKSPDNTTYAIGRYAYAVYNEGALLDVNVAGMPASLSAPATFATQRGLLPQVDLANLLQAAPINLAAATASSAADALVQWRNAATIASSAGYAQSVLNTTTGFTSVGYDAVTAATDQAFTSRQDLIDYVKHNSSIPTAALPFLGTFTLTSDQPSYYPDAGRPEVSSQDDITNPNVMRILVQHAFQRADGLQAVVGEPLLKHRFPLSRLALFQNPTFNRQSIIKYFAMQPDHYNPALWDYIDPDTGSVASTLPSIKTLDQVASIVPAREPTFWELLQAGVLTGSLGVDVPGPVGSVTSQNQNATRQIFEIGLSIMDQYDQDDNPTVLNFGGENPANPNDLFVAGIENLPYVMWIAHQSFQDNWNPPASGKSLVDGYLMFALWNPHRNAGSASPGIYRIRVNGTSTFQARVSGTDVSGNYSHTDTVLPFQTTAGRLFQSIDLLRASDVPTPLYPVSPAAQFPYPMVGSTPKEVGILIGQVRVPTYTTGGNNPVPAPMNFVFPLPLSIVLEKQVVINRVACWVPYQVIPSYQGNCTYDGTAFAQLSSAMNAGNFTADGTSNSNLINAAHSDPRTNRFGFGAGSQADQVPSRMLSNGFNIIDTSGQTIAPFSPFGSMLTPTFSAGTYALADYAYNQAAGSGSYYTDRDGVVRKADSNPASTARHSVDSPYTYSSLAGMFQSPSDAQPIMLNRAFASVAEMGYAFRDDPWRTLNFSSQDSADGGLLDLFSVTDTTNANRAGVVDVNNASATVLTALLTNAYRDPSAADGATLGATDAASIAAAIHQRIISTNAPHPLLNNVADLPLLITDIATSLPDAFKYKREAVTRSLADVMNTRTWNLMIDIIAQSGHYDATARGLDDFTVEGERRYWVHLALDRFSGKVLAMQSELVTE